MYSLYEKESRRKYVTEYGDGPHDYASVQDEEEYPVRSGFAVNSHYTILSVK